MCTTVWYLGTKTHSDPIKDRRGCWKPGMLIDVQEDGFDWGGIEGKGPYLVIDFPDIPANVIAEKWGEPEFEDPDVPKLDRQIYRRRRFVLQIPNVTPQLKILFANKTLPPATRIAALDAVTEDRTITDPH